MAEWRVIQGHVLDALRSLEEESVQLCITSPPYFGLREYGTTPQIWGGDSSCKHHWKPQQYELQKHGDNGSGGNLEGGRKGQKATRLHTIQSAVCSQCGAWQGSLGCEPTPDRYIADLVEIFAAVRAILRPDGSLWIVIADSYARPPGKGIKFADGSSTYLRNRQAEECNRGLPVPDGMKEKDLIGIPWMLAMALRADGWYLREEVIWWKPGPQPDSVNGWRWEKHRVKVSSGKRGKEPQRKGACPDRPQQDHDGKDFAPSAEYIDCPGCDKCDPHQGWVLRKGSWRCTRAHEYLLHLTKSSDAYSDKYAVIERSSGRSSGNKQARVGNDYGRLGHHVREGPPYDSDGYRNKRSVWRIPTESSRHEHYAAFPRKLIRDPILASTSEAGECRKCGSPWARIIERARAPKRADYGAKHAKADKQSRRRRLQQAARGARAAGGDHNNPFQMPKTLAWRPTCECGLGDPVPQIVCDPFVGSGTSGVVAATLGRSFIGIDLNQNYCKMARKRIREAVPLFAKEKT